jgi:hypothetical protein
LFACGALAATGALDTTAPVLAPGDGGHPRRHGELLDR